MPLSKAGTGMKSTVPATAEQGSDSLDGKSCSGNRLDLFSHASHMSGHQSIIPAAPD